MPSSPIIVTEDFLPNGGLASTMSTFSDGSCSSASSTSIGGVGVEVGAADAVEEQVHRAQARGVVDDFVAAERLVAEEALLVAVELGGCSAM